LQVSSFELQDYQFDQLANSPIDRLKCKMHTSVECLGERCRVQVASAREWKFDTSINICYIIL